MTFRSKIYRGRVVHERLSPKSHRFSYPMTFFGFDLAELQDIHAQVSLFGYNKVCPVRLNDSDYLMGDSVPVIEQLNRLLPREESGQYTLLITSPKYFGYAFNPVNFHLRMEGARLICAVVEVNNTFGDRHVYPLENLENVDAQRWTAACSKDFHVSPFNDMAGAYRFTFQIKEDAILLGVDLYKEGICVMKTWIQGEAKSLTNNNVVRYALVQPFDTALNSMPRIIWQAAVLYFKKRMRVFKRPSPISENTLIDRDTKEGVRPVV